MNTIKNIIITALFLLSSIALQAQSKQISLSAKNAPIKEVFAEIQQKSGYRILYNDEIVADDLRVSVDAQDVAVKDLLNIMLQNSGLTFVQQSGEMIVITKEDFVKTTNQITGMVVDENGEPVPFANVVQLSLPDSTFINGVNTGVNGRFSLQRENNKPVILEVTYLGYEPYRVQVTLNNMGNIQLKPSSILLGEVVVKGDLPMIVLKNDAVVANVQNTALSKAGTGNDVLKRLPLLTGDNGSFSVFGKGQAKIYINNREMRNTSELDNLNSTDIKNVEIVTNPGARYDASVKAVIRINTARKVGDGFSFDIRSTYQQSQFVDIAEQLNVNYRKKGWDIFGTVAYYQNRGFQDSKMWQKTYVDTLWTQENKLYWERGSNTVMGVAGVNYEISAKHFVGAKYTVFTMPRDSSKTITNSTVLANGEFYDNWSSDEYAWKKQKPTHRVNAYYNGTIGDLNIDFNTDFYQNQEKTNTNTTEISQEYDNRSINSINAISNQLIAAKLILSYPVLGGEFSLGNEMTKTRREDDYQNIQGIVPSTNTRINNQNISLFAEYSKSIYNVQVGAGLRYEKVCSEYIVNDVLQEEQSRRYSQWFPNLSLSTQLKNVSLQLSYTVKTRRPSYRELGSNILYINRFSIFSGNPFLKPSTIHDVTFVGAWKDIQLLVSYKNENDAVIYWAEQMKDNPAISFTTYRNLENIPSLNTFITYSPKVGIWSPLVSVGLLKQWLSTTCDNKPISLNKPIVVATLNNSFSLPKGLIVTLDMSYQGKGNTQVHYMADDYVVVDMGISKSFFDNRLNVAVKGLDLFYQNQYGHITYYPAQEYYQHNRYGSRRFQLTVRYKFNSARSKYKGTGAGQSEINRL